MFHNVVMDTNSFDRMYFWRENSYSYLFNLEQIVLAERSIITESNFQSCSIQTLDLCESHFLNINSETH